MWRWSHRPVSVARTLALRIAAKTVAARVSGGEASSFDGLKATTGPVTQPPHTCLST